MACVLWVSVETPDRHGQGGQRRQYHQIQALQALGHRVDVLALAGEQSAKSISALTLTRRMRVSIRGHFMGLLLGRFRRAIERADCDAIVVSHVDSVWLLPPRERLRVPVLVDVHNVLSDWYERLGRDSDVPEWLRREEEAVSLATALTTCSDLERDRLVAHHPAAAGKTFAAPLGVDPAEWPTVDFSRDEPLLALFGSWGWSPNTRGLEWFVTQVWPGVHAAEPAARALVAGSGAEDIVGTTPGIDVVGRVPDLATFTASATIVPVPVRVGVGAAVKFAESLASGAAVVATAEGASAFPDAPAFVSDDPQEWVDWILQRLRNRQVEPVPHPGRAFALAELTWENAVRPVDRWLAEITR
jgi:glycosyltransferase involved in cell wall biosynthesis